MSTQNITGQQCPNPSPTLAAANMWLMELRRAAQRRLVVNDSQATNGRFLGVQQ